MQKTKLLSLLALLLMAVTQGAWAQDTYTVQFKANGNTKTVENVTLPHTFSCDYDNENGELDQIIKQLYGLDGGCCAISDPSVSGNENVTVGLNGENQYITVSAPFEGTATVSGGYFDSGYQEVVYSLEVSIPGYTASVAVTSITLSQTEAAMTVGGATLTLTPTVLPADATDKGVTWTTSDASVAIVADGVVTAVGEGTATITATANDGSGVTGTCTVTVSTLVTYTVTWNDDDAEAANWSISPAAVAEGGTLTATYSGTRHVKSVKYVQKTAAPE